MMLLQLMLLLCDTFANLIIQKYILQNDLGSFAFLFVKNTTISSGNRQDRLCVKVQCCILVLR